ncbi:hypothetical protein [Pedobacter frigiditerrae]|uniref:hypothetical protein n=1 Tax=Pedobacter frigiditerrae TaxID=2530452 RepID=UPI00292E9368|nr:hypothetical protein [Pedobacter frigiditerrae]
MAKESFNWKGLFVNEDTNNEKNESPAPVITKELENKFPDQQQQYFTENSLPNPFLTDILAVYEKGFESLNAQGFDFFELYKSVMAVGVTNPQSYQMAFTMGKTINPSLTKEFLVEKAKFYIAEIEKVHSKYDTDGKTKKSTLDTNISAQKQSLTKSITDLESKIAQLQQELATKKAELLKVGEGNREQYSEIQLKIEANNFAKNKILESINTVLTGVNQYL